MSSLDLLDKYVFDESEFFNEYDSSSFIMISNSVLNKKIADFLVFIKDTESTTLLESAIRNLNTIDVESYAMTEFMTKILGSSKVDRAGLMMKDITKNGKINVKMQYLKEAVNDLKYNINDLLSGKIDADSAIVNIKTMTASSYKDKLKQRTVEIYNIPYIDDPKKFISNVSYISTPLTIQYLNSVIIPYVENFQKTKVAITTETNFIIREISNDISELSLTMKTLNSVNIPDDKKSIILNYCYNTVRTILEVIKYVTYCQMRKIHIIEENITAIQETYNKLMLLFASETSLVEAGAYDTRIITAADGNNLIEAIFNGQIDAFVELSNSIIEYHKGYIFDKFGMDKSDSDTIMAKIITDDSYDKKIYDDIVKSYIEIGNGLDILAKNSNDYLMVFDDLKNKSGFVIPLPERFKTEIDRIKDIHNYGLTNLSIGNGGEKTDTYFRILSEIIDYPKNMTRIAKTVCDMWQKFEYVDKLFTSGANGELAYSETMNELKILLESLKEQYKIITKSVSDNMYLRLKLLAEKADQCLDNVGSEDKTNIEELIPTPNRNFMGEAALGIIDFQNELTDLYMDIYMKEYYSEREYLEKGVRLVYEADGNTNTNNANKPDTHVVVNDNPEAKNSTSSTKLDSVKLSNILKAIADWFKKMVDAFTNMINKYKAKNTDWLAEHKDGLLNRSYSNVQIDILPYDRGPTTQKIDQDITSFTTNLNTMTKDNIAKINTYEELRSKLITGVTFNANEDEKAAITRYYKVGNNKLETVKYSNNEIKTYVSQHMIPYCEVFYTTYYDSLNKKLKDVEKSMEDVIKTYATEAFTELASDGSIFYEEGEQNNQPATNATTTTTVTTGTTNTNQNNNAGANIVQKTTWIQTCVRNYIGCILTAIRDRNNDYLEALFALVPKTENTKTTGNKNDNGAPETDANTQTQ